MHLLLLHGTTGIWDEVVCLVIPATAIMGVALAVLRERPVQDDAAAEKDDGDVADEPDQGEVPGGSIRSEG